MLLLAVSCSPSVSEDVQPASDLFIEDLRTEYLVNPLGIDTPLPRLSWILTSEKRNRHQTAYQIEATDDQGDIVWDSGKVLSEQSIHVEYGGRSPVSGERITWRVRVWDEADRSTKYSEPAWFEMGLLSPDDWNGQWIAGTTKQEYTPSVPARPFGGTRWIWGPAGGSNMGLRTFAHTFTIPPDRTTASIKGVAIVDDRFRLFMNGNLVAEGDGSLYLTPMVISPDLIRTGENTIVIEAQNEADLAGVLAQLRVSFTDGAEITVKTDGAWLTRPGHNDLWREAAVDSEQWTPSRIVGLPDREPWGRLALAPQALPAPLLRKAFTVGKNVARARIYIAGLGYHEVYINGRKAGDHVLDPGFTRYDRRVLYVTHDVTDLLSDGPNAVGVMLGNGFFNTHANDVWDFHDAAWRATPRMLFQMEIVYSDGSSDVLVSDASWKTVTGPVVFDGVRNGEVYDARLEQPGWASTDADESGWRQAVEVNGPAGLLDAQTMPPMKVTQTINPVSVTQVNPGIYVFDMGQNMAGWARLHVSGPAGTVVTMRYGEKLHADGTLDQSNIWTLVRQGPFQTDTYIMKGDGEEVWEPRFTYHGFQYVEVTGLPGTPDEDTIEGRVVHTAFPITGTFRSSNPMINKMQEATLWSYRSNFHSIPTDCPHREKNGWMGDALLATELAMFNFDNAAGYTKWINDVADTQRDTGELPGIVPTSGWGYDWGNGPGWESAYLLIPWTMYWYLGDRRILENHYEGFKRYLDYLTDHDYMEENPDGWLGDWVHIDQTTPEAVTHAGYHVQNAEMMARTAALLGRLAEADLYEALADRVREAFVEKYVDTETGQVSTGSQTAQSCALYQDLVQNPELQRLVLAQLVSNIENEENHINTGVLGARYLPWALSDNGRSDLFYKILTQPDYPGWGHWIEQGATSLWEDWNGNASLNHIFFGDISAWFYRILGGINTDPEAPAFEHIIFRPEVPDALTWIEAETRTIRGTVASSWRLEENRWVWTLTVPVNCTATVYVPAATQDRIEADGGRYLGAENGRQIYEVGSGEYQFVVFPFDI